MLLRNEIKNRNTQFYADESFFFYIWDHKKEIKDNSTQLVLTPEMKVSYNNRYKDILIDNNLDNSLFWIFLIINDIKSMEQIYDKSVLYLPKRSYINELRLKFRNLNARYNTKPIKLDTIKK